MWTRSRHTVNFSIAAWLMSPSRAPVRRADVHERREDTRARTEPGCDQGDSPLAAGVRRKEQASVSGRRAIARIEHWIKAMLSDPLRYNLHYGRVVKLAATADSKSAEGNLMSVRLRPRPPSTAPLKFNAKISQDGSIRLKPSLVENGSKFTHFLTQFLVLYDYLTDIK